MEARPRRSGFAALVGAPNAGKSTLLNRLTGTKLAIVSPKEQTTRSRILGVVTRPEGQIAFVDTPGLHRASGGLNRYLVDLALRELDNSDLALFLVEASVQEETEIDPVNQFILERLITSRKQAFLVINKIDRVKNKSSLLALIDLYRRELPFVEVLPISARTGEGVDDLIRLALDNLPPSEILFDEDTLTDQQERTLVAEYVREQVFRHCRQEVPYSCAVTVDAFDESERASEKLGSEKPKKQKKGTKKRPGPSGLVRIYATIHLERDSQKAIVIGRRGQMLKAIGTDARASMERLLDARVFLSLAVRVEPGWSERPEALRKLGYE